jgi:hypothetical protein
MVHCGYESTAVAATFNSLKAFARVAKLTVLGPGRETAPPDEPPVDSGSTGDDAVRKIQLPVLSS